MDEPAREGSLVHVLTGVRAMRGVGGDAMDARRALEVSHLVGYVGGHEGEVGQSARGHMQAVVKMSGDGVGRQRSQVGVGPGLVELRDVLTQFLGSQG
eukprot:5071428-Prymnesium_polylepis.1